MTTSHPQAPAMPPVVYVPTTRGPAPELRQVLMHTLEDGRTALYTYSAPDRLDSFYRVGQPWVLCDVTALQRLHDSSPYEVLFVDVDPALPAEENEDGGHQ